MATYLIVGLGNPGSEYLRTRHNAGFMVVERLAQRWNAGWTLDKKFTARVARAAVAGHAVWLCQPQTWMNLSGAAVGAMSRFYQVALTELLVISDDADLSLGQIRMRERGSSGGHHGLESIEQQLGSREWARLKVGIGRMPHEGPREISGHVLGKIAAHEQPVFEPVLDRAVLQAATWVEQGAAKAMSLYNGSAIEPK